MTDQSIFRLTGGRKQSPEVNDWLKKQDNELGTMARCWMEEIRGCGSDVIELIHDGRPTACIADVPFVYVAVYKAHIGIGFFRGAELTDPDGLLEGSGKMMRHIKIRPEKTIRETAICQLIATAYGNARRHVASLPMHNDE